MRTSSPHAPTRRTRVAVAGSVAVLALVAGACGYHPDRPAVHLSDPGHCVTVDVASAPEIASLLGDAATRFNGSGAARLRSGRCAFVRVEAVDSPVALHELLAGWPDTQRLGPAPAAWVPGSTMWSALLDARLTDRHRRPMAPAGRSIARSPLVVAMPAPMAAALGYPRRPIGWADLAQLAGDPRGWGVVGHAEWGPFRLGKGNPNWSTTGLDQTVAVDTTSGTVLAAALEHAVAYYGDTTLPYFDNWLRLATTSRSGALRYLSALITDERSVVAFDTGHAQDDVALTARRHAPPLGLVAVYPKDATIESDYPIVALDAQWTSADQGEGARLFTRFMLRPAQQADVAAAGFRPATGSTRSPLLRTTAGVDASARTVSVAPASPRSIEQSLARWQATRRRARVLVLFDVSNSMGDPADTPQPGLTDPGVTKLARAKGALTRALDQLGPDDEIGLRIFSTKLGRGRHPDANWQDLVPSGPYAARRPALHAAIASLVPRDGSPLYAATRAAFDAAARGADPRRIDAVVLVTDGYNEDDRDTNEHALLAHLASNPNVRVFTVAYTNDADFATLHKIAQATNAWCYDSRDSRDITEQLSRALASV